MEPYGLPSIQVPEALKENFSPAEAERWMKNTGATLLAAPIHIDVLEHPIPEDEAVARFESTLETA